MMQKITGKRRPLLLRRGGWPKARRGGQGSNEVSVGLTTSPFGHPSSRGGDAGLKRLAFIPLLLLTGLLITTAQTPAPQATGPQAVITQYCATCHSDKVKTGGLTLESLDIARVGANAQTWEKVVRKVRSGMMPPSGAKRPARAALDSFA